MTPEQIAADWESACVEVRSFLRDRAATHWETPVAGEQWPLGGVARHIARGCELFARWIEQAQAGGPVGTSRAGHRRGQCRGGDPAA